MPVLPLPFGLGGSSAPKSQARYLGLDGNAYNTAEETLVADRVYQATQASRQASQARGMPNVSPVAPIGSTPTQRVANASQNSSRASELRGMAPRMMGTGPEVFVETASVSKPAPAKVSSRGASAAAPAKSTKTAKPKSSGTGASVTVLVDPSGQRAPVIESVTPMSGASATGSIRQQEQPWQSAAPQRVQAAGAANPVTTVQEGPGLGLEELRLAALDEVLARFKAGGGAMSYTPGSGNDPYMSGGVRSQYAAPGYSGQPYQFSQVLGGGTGDPSSFTPGTSVAEGPRPPGDQYAAEAIAAYILSAYQDPNLQGNMTMENLQFLRNLR